MTLERSERLTTAFPYYSRFSVLWIIAFFATAVLTGLRSQLTPYMWIASANCLLFWLGFSLRKVSIRYHAFFLLLGMISDTLLVLTLQMQRHAVQTALKMELSILNQAHILSSLLAVLFYIPMIVLGFTLLRQLESTKVVSGSGSTRVRRTHRMMGWTVLVLRTLGFLLMFSMLKPPVGPTL